MGGVERIFIVQVESMDKLRGVSPASTKSRMRLNRAMMFLQAKARAGPDVCGVERGRATTTTKKGENIER